MINSTLRQSAAAEDIAAHPDEPAAGINTRFGIGMSRQINEMAAQNRIDVGFVHGSSGLPGVKETFVAETFVHCLMAANHPLSELAEITVGVLSDYPLITFDVESPPSVQIRETFSKAGLLPNVRTEINASLLAAQAVRNKTVAFVDPLSAVVSPGLVLKQFSPKIPLSIFILTHRNKTPSQLVSAFCDTARHQIFRSIMKCQTKVPDHRANQHETGRQRPQ